MARERDILQGDTGLPAFDAPGVGTGDLIDLSRIDADATASGDQAFAWSGLEPGGRGTLWLSRSGSLTLVNGNLDDDAAIEFQLIIEDGERGRVRLQGSRLHPVSRARASGARGRLLGPIPTARATRRTAVRSSCTL